MRMIIFICLLLLQLVTYGQARAEIFFVIEASFLKCMESQSKDYLELVGSDGLLYIPTQKKVAEDCPAVPTEPMLEFSQNYGPEGPDANNNSNEPDKLLILSRSEFACLFEKLPDPLSAGYYRFFPERCLVEKQ